MARVSIVMPVFNPGPYLAEALASVTAQTYRDRELVLVDDGSTDPATVAALDRAATEPGVTLHRTPNRGPAAARNLGIEHAGGAYILPLDADDFLGPTFLERTVPALDGHPELAIVHTWIALVGGHHGTWRTGPFALRDLLSRCTIHVSSLYRREVWADVGGYDPRFADTSEDWDFWLGAAARGWKGHGVPEVLASYRRSPTSRERRARAPGTSGRVMRTLVAKHRALYETHLEDAMAGLYEQLTAASLTLERVYQHPAIRLALRLRALFGE
jgi:glycosyltransferase involved in cell wall biosynthesis